MAAWWLEEAERQFRLALCWIRLARRLRASDQPVAEEWLDRLQTQVLQVFVEAPWISGLRSLLNLYQTGPLADCAYAWKPDFATRLFRHLDGLMPPEPVAPSGSDDFTRACKETLLEAAKALAQSPNGSPRLPGEELPPYPLDAPAAIRRWRTQALAIVNWKPWSLNFCEGSGDHRAYAEIRLMGQWIEELRGRMAERQKAWRASRWLETNEFSRMAEGMDALLCGFAESVRLLGDRAKQRGAALDYAAFDQYVNDANALIVREATWPAWRLAKLALALQQSGVEDAVPLLSEKIEGLLPADDPAIVAAGGCDLAMTLVVAVAALLDQLDGRDPGKFDKARSNLESFCEALLPEWRIRLVREFDSPDKICRTVAYHRPRRCLATGLLATTVATGGDDGAAGEPLVLRPAEFEEPAAVSPLVALLAAARDSLAAEDGVLAGLCGELADGLQGGLTVSEWLNSAGEGVRLPSPSGRGRAPCTHGRGEGASLPSPSGRGRAPCTHGRGEGGLRQDATKDGVVGEIAPLPNPLPEGEGGQWSRPVHIWRLIQRLRLLEFILANRPAGDGAKLKTLIANLFVEFSAAGIGLAVEPPRQASPAADGAAGLWLVGRAAEPGQELTPLVIARGAGLWITLPDRAGTTLAPAALAVLRRRDDLPLWQRFLGDHEGLLAELTLLDPAPEFWTELHAAGLGALCDSGVGAGPAKVSSKPEAQARNQRSGRDSATAAGPAEVTAEQAARLLTLIYRRWQQAGEHCRKPYALLLRGLLDFSETKLQARIQPALDPKTMAARPAGPGMPIAGRVRLKKSGEPAGTVLEVERFGAGPSPCSVVVSGGGRMSAELEAWFSLPPAVELRADPDGQMARLAEQVLDNGGEVLRARVPWRRVSGNWRPGWRRRRARRGSTISLRPSLFGTGLPTPPPIGPGGSIGPASSGL